MMLSNGCRPDDSGHEDESQHSHSKYDFDREELFMQHLERMNLDEQQFDL